MVARYRPLGDPDQPILHYSSLQIRATVEFLFASPTDLDSGLDSFDDVGNDVGGT
ncbi:MAG: hypothetical protein GY773_24555 [Actinomycetia bacterium]|nr:hypothetical protein [Actinomycetes bacterium]MCP5035358.1 hypothetical protein [Actinomycetes bacterium]